MIAQPMERFADEPHWALVDLFSGCGGTSAGFAATGDYVLHYAADIDGWANRTYARNLGLVPTQLDLGAVVESGSASAWAARIRSTADKPVALIGCAPCQGFSSHVKRAGDKHGRNELLEALGELSCALRPEAIVIENVPDLFARRNWRSFVRLRERLVDAGYRIRARVVNFAELGVPQERFRGVILARLGIEPTFPPVQRAPESFATVREWMGHLPAVDSGGRHESDPMHQASQHRPGTLEVIRQVPQDGGSRPVGVGPRCLDETRARHGGYTDVYGRLAWDAPAPTITARCRTPSCGRFVHPQQHRGLTAREAALLQTFPAEWHFEGPFDDRFKQIGNAVPPLAAYAFARHISTGWPTVANEVGCIEVTDRPIGESFSVLIPGIRRRRRSAA